MVATIVYFVLGGMWYTLLKDAWLLGIGRTMEDFTKSGQSPAVPYCIAVVCAAVMAWTLSWVIQASGEQTAARGASVAALLWLGLVLTTFATEYAFEMRGVRILTINAGYPLVGMVLQGAILGGWRKK